MVCATAAEATIGAVERKGIVYAVKGGIVPCQGPLAGLTAQERDNLTLILGDRLDDTRLCQCAGCQRVFAELRARREHPCPNCGAKIRQPGKPCLHCGRCDTPD